MNSTFNIKTGDVKNQFIFALLFHVFVEKIMFLNLFSKIKYKLMFLINNLRLNTLKCNFVREIQLKTLISFLNMSSSIKSCK